MILFFGKMGYSVRKDQTRQLDNRIKKWYNQNRKFCFKGECAMKWVILGVIFGVCAIIRGNGVAFK